MKSIIGLVGINISWMAIGALLDLSTILTYSIGALPLGAAKELTQKDTPILAISSFFDYQSKATQQQSNQKATEAYLYYRRGSINIPECVLYNGLIIGPKYYPTIPHKPDISFAGRDINNQGTQYCALNSQTLADITTLEQWKDSNISHLHLSGRINNHDRNILMKTIIQNLESSNDC